MPVAVTPSLASPSHVDLIAGLVKTHLKPNVVRIDRQGHYPADTLHRLGAAGAFIRPGAPDALASALHASRIVSRTCGSTGFLTWCQNASAWYLAHTANTALRDRYFAAVGDARQLAGTALSNPVKHFSGFEPLKLRGYRVAGGFHVSGTLPWVSNLGGDHTFAIVFAVEEAPVMAYVRASLPGLSLLRCATFAGLEGTATFGVRFDHVFVSDDDLLASPAQPFVRQIQPGFMLLQVGLGLGLIDGALDDIAAADRTHAAVNAHLPDRPGALAAALEKLTDRTHLLAVSQITEGRDYFREVAHLRLDTAELALRAAVSASLHAGAIGFIATSSPQRRLREAHFFAILTPSIRHLRHLLHSTAA